MAFYYTGTHYTRATLWQPYTILLTHQNTNVGGHGSSPQNIDNHVKSVLFSSNNNVHKILSWQNVYNIVYSQAVTHPSTNTTQCCLTSVIGRELVFSTWYGRRHFGLKRYHTLSDWSTLSPHVNKNLFLYNCLIHVKQWTLICPQPFTFPMVFGPRQISGEKDWPTAQSIPRRSPIQVLTPPNVA